MAQLRRSGQHSFQSTAIFDRDGHRPQCRPMNMTYATIVSVCSFRGGQQKTRLPVAKPTIMPVREPRHDLLLETWKNLFRGSKACFGRFGPDHPNDIVATTVDPSLQLRCIEEYAHQQTIFCRCDRFWRENNSFASCSKESPQPLRLSFGSQEPYPAGALQQDALDASI